MWIGGRALLGTGYEWLDGQPFTYDNWAKGEPNNVNGEQLCQLLYESVASLISDSRLTLTVRVASPNLLTPALLLARGLPLAFLPSLRNSQTGRGCLLWSN